MLKSNKKKLKKFEKRKISKVPATLPGLLYKNSNEREGGAAFKLRDVDKNNSKFPMRKLHIQLIELFCIARLIAHEKEERRSRAWTEMKANGNFN